MSDYEVMSALEALIDQYEKEKSGRPLRKFRLSEREHAFVDEKRSRPSNGTRSGGGRGI